MDTFLQRLRSATGTRPAPPETATPELVQLLRAEQHHIRQLFDAYEDLLAEAASDPVRQELAARICLALALHALVEEEVVYPAARQWPACRRAVAEAEVEHAVARLLIDELAAREPDDPLFDAHVSVLSGHVRRHVEQAETTLLPMLARLADDLPGLAGQARQRRLALQRELDAFDDGG